MTLPRRRLIDPGITPYYHCVSRCVRRAFLCGRDALTGRDFEHRRHWLEARLHELAEIFAIDLCAYAVMSNHFHVVLRINTEQQAVMNDDDIVARWTRLFSPPDGFEHLSDVDRQSQIECWRERLASISWFMRCVSEPLARRANREDGCRGRFWEGRFRSQALLDEAAVVKCMVYVDLNPIRAGMAATPEGSEHTSVKARTEQQPGSLAPMAGDGTNAFQVPIRRLDYLRLVDATGRQLRHGKQARIEPSLRPILERLAQPPEVWFEDMKNLTRRYCRAIGEVASLVAFRDAIGQQRLRGLTTP